VAAAVALALALFGCDVPKGSTSPIDGLGVPYPVGDARTEHSGTRQLLGQARLVPLLDIEPPESEPNILSVVALEALIGPDDPRYTAVIGYAGRAPVPRAKLVKAEVLPEHETVTLVGETGICHAHVEDVIVWNHVADPTWVGVGTRLSHCTADTWAPIGIVNLYVPEQLRWRAAVDEIDHTIERTAAGLATWEHPLADWLEAPTWSGDDEPTGTVVQMRMIPEVDPTVIEVHWGLARPSEDSDDPCVHAESWRSYHGEWDGQRFDAFEPVADPQLLPRLLGAVVHDRQVDALIYETGEMLEIAVPPVTTVDGSQTPWVHRTFGPVDLAPAGSVWSYSTYSRTVGWQPECPE
jgi:hypothetical protein